MEWFELIVAAVAVISIGFALLLSALGIITIPDAAYQTLSTLVLALVGTRGRRMSQKRTLTKEYGKRAPDDVDQDEHPDAHEVDDDA